MNSSRIKQTWISNVLVGLISLLAASVTLAADSAVGKAMAPVCAACHGQDGASAIDPSYANLAGQNESYLLNQLLMIQGSDPDLPKRDIPLMAGQLNGKSAEDLANLAAYYASLPAKTSQAEGDDGSVAMGQMIYRGGILKKGVAACTSCHSPIGMGNGPAGFPRISGQNKAYTVAQLTEYREGRRQTDEPNGGMMRDIASMLTDTEIAALADYLQGLH